MSSAFPLVLALWAVSAAANELSVTGLEQITDNRGWNEAGIGPHYQMVVTAIVSPSGFPTVVYAERNGVREPFLHFPQPSAPDLYVVFQRVTPASVGAWRITAERSGTKSVSILTPGVAKPWQVPLAQKVRATGRGAEPRIDWAIPDLGGRAIGRVRVAVRGEPRVHGRFMSTLYVSEDLPATATSFTIPPGVLKLGQRYVFQVTLEDLEDGVLKNRSMAFTDLYTVRD